MSELAHAYSIFCTLPPTCTFHKQRNTAWVPNLYFLAHKSMVSYAGLHWRLSSLHTGTHITLTHLTCASLSSLTGSTGEDLVCPSSCYGWLWEGGMRVSYNPAILQHPHHQVSNPEHHMTGWMKVGLHGKLELELELQWLGWIFLLQLSLSPQGSVYIILGWGCPPAHKDCTAMDSKVAWAWCRLSCTWMTSEVGCCSLDQSSMCCGMDMWSLGPMEDM